MIELSLAALVIGIVYPAYMTLKLLQQQTDVNSKAFKVYTLYWVIFTSLETLNWFIPDLVYFVVFKLAVIAVLQFPSINNCEFLYDYLKVNWYPVYHRLTTEEKDKAE